MTRKFTQKKVKPKKAPPKKIPKEKMAAYLESLEKKGQEKIIPEPKSTNENEAFGVSAEEEKKEEAVSEKAPAIESSSGQTADSLAGQSTWEDLKTEKKQGFFWPVLLFALLGFVIGIVFFAYQEGIKKGETDVYTAVSPTVTPPTTPTEVVVDKKAYTISVLNGSGKRGEAAKAKSYLSKEGFIVDTVGNAERSDYNDTIIQARSSVATAYLEELTKTMKNASYDVSEPEILAEKGKADVIITIGRNRDE
ncbi:MAG: LytR C-terminal domain-containing protein [Candidatus Levybacteria bacterium]|nr:LytR C-terminal domain-containing protein [Candidatus Levybacteria bacterium]